MTTKSVADIRCVSSSETSREPTRTGCRSRLFRNPRSNSSHAFQRIKSLTVYGYFTSELVVKEVLHTSIMPGKADGCVSL